MRHPLTRALASVGLNADDVAARLAVDPKTVQRWFTGRVPYPRHRTALAELTGWGIRDLWPEAEPPAQPTSTADEVCVVYASRALVPVDAWHTLFRRAERAVDVLAYSALFLAEDGVAQRILRERADAGVRVRLALGDSDDVHVAQRGADEGIGEGMAGRIRIALVLFRSLAMHPGVTIRLHNTVLYNSLYRADDDLFLNPHVYSCPASHTPVVHLRGPSGSGMFNTYLDSFERVWASAAPLREQDG